MFSMLQDFLQQQGYALCEYLGDGEFSLLAVPPAWFTEIWNLPAANSGGPADASPKSLRLGDDSPFLESFLIEAQEFWNSSAPGAVASGPWLERSRKDLGPVREIPLEALALRIDDKPVLSIQSQPAAFEERTHVLQTARDGLLAHERLRREIQKKEILLHCIIHDLSQPLTAMRGCFEILGMEGGSSRIKQMVELGKKQSEQQEEMIREVLKAFSADLQDGIEPGATASTLPNLLTCAEETVAAFEPTFEAKGMKLRMDPRLAGQPGWQVMGEATRVKRIFSNLVENSLRYAPVGSVVTIGIEEEIPYLKAYVEDQGPGLPKDFQAAEAFKLFGKGKVGGGKAGLGLYFCRITVERWGGTIGCETVVPTGARFWFRLLAARKQSDTKPVGESLKAPADAGHIAKPPANVAAAAEVGPLVRPPAPPGLQILLADDDSAIRELTELLLTRQGHKVVVVENGKEVLRVLPSRHFDVVLLDDEMPGLSGAETAKRVRAAEKNSGRHQFMLSLSGNNTESDKRRLMDAGVDACLSKPFHAEALNQALLAFQISPRLAVTSSEIPKPPTKPEVSADADAAMLRRVGGDEQLLQRMIEVFLKDLPKKLALLRKTLARKDAAAFAAAAHAVKGSVSIFGAEAARLLAEELQNMGRAGQLSGAADRLARLEEEIANLEKKLRGYRAEASRTGSPSGKGKAGVRRRQKRVER